MEGAFVVSAFVTLFVVMDPIGLTPIFAVLTQGVGPAQRRMIALRACVVAAVLLTVFGTVGEQILGFVGITMPAFRIAGGLLLFLTALDMLFERRTRRRESRERETDPAEDPSVFPLAMPLIAGPGAMASMILLTGQAGPNLAGVAAVHLVMLAVLGMVFALFLAAGLLERALGRTGIMVITRLLGMLLAALSVQFILDGLRGAGLVAAAGG
ncbi:MarC family transcriptional regulator [Rhodobacteraceae bacterium WD3A24]|nr:MarC family transcriptional regulator [Rhodobacteraceae bacterium WD3A24]